MARRDHPREGGGKGADRRVRRVAEGTEKRSQDPPSLRGVRLRSRPQRRRQRWALENRRPQASSLRKEIPCPRRSARRRRQIGGSGLGLQGAVAVSLVSEVSDLPSRAFSLA